MFVSVIYIIINGIIGIALVMPVANIFREDFRFYLGIHIITTVILIAYATYLKVNSK
jgi:hypothetical protein